MTTLPPPPATRPPHPRLPDAPAPSREVGVRALLALLMRRRLVVALVFLLMGASVVTGLSLAEREYTATARVAATPPSDATATTASPRELLGTVAAVASSRPLLEEVSRRLPERTVAQLRDEVSGAVVDDTVIVQISVTDADPRVAAAVADLVVEALPAFDPTGGTLDFKTTENAAVPDTFSAPDIPLTAVAGLGLAAVLAVAAAAAADRMLRAVTEVDELAEASSTTVLGALPQPDDAAGLSLADPSGAEANALRALRIGVEFASAQDPVRVVVVAPAAEPDPTGGWLEVNLAAALAEAGHRVLLVDADRQQAPTHPALAHPDSPGLHEVLAGGLALPQAVLAGPVPGVEVLPLGAPGPAAASLIEMRTGGLLADTEERYDVVVVRTAPVTACEDARTIALHGALLLTVAAGRVHPRHVQEAAEHLRMIHVRVLGSVLSGVRTARSRRAARVGAA